MDLKILSGGAANGLVTRLTPAFTEATGMGITGDFGAVGGMRDRVLEGEAVDLIILTRKIVDELAAGGHVDPATVTDVGRVATAVAVREGEAMPDVSSPDALKAALTSADAIYVADMVKATAGIHQPVAHGPWQGHVTTGQKGAVDVDHGGLQAVGREVGQRKLGNGEVGIPIGGQPLLCRQSGHSRSSSSASIRG